MPSYKRTITLERAPSAPLGTVRAVLATDGEASDGHVLSIRGGELAPGIPLLFGHDSSSGRANLGSWQSFTFKPHEIHGEAQIELDGAGAQREWRADVATMIAAGHISAVSVRWEPIGKPQKRTSMAPAHHAYVDEKRETDYAKLNGYYFAKWRALEGSVVTLGSDKAAIVKRSEETSGEVSELWRQFAEQLDDEGDLPDEEREADLAEDVLDPDPVRVTPPVVPTVQPTVVLPSYQEVFAATLVRIQAANDAALRDMQTRAAELYAAARGR